MRKSSYFFIFLITNLVVFVISIFDGIVKSEEGAAQRKTRLKIVKELNLTDLCLFTEARYTRHISQSDIHTPFQDHPLSLEHFPSGSLFLPPELLTAISTVRSDEFKVNHDILGKKTEVSD